MHGELSQCMECGLTWHALPRLQEVVQELRGMACICADGVAEGLRNMEPGDGETMRGMRAANRGVHLILDLAKRFARSAFRSWQ